MHKKLMLFISILCEMCFSTSSCYNNLSDMLISHYLMQYKCVTKQLKICSSKDRNISEFFCFFLTWIVALTQFIFDTKHTIADLNNIHKFHNIRRIFMRIRTRTDRRTKTLFIFVGKRQKRKKYYGDEVAIVGETDSCYIHWSGMFYFLFLF